MVNYLSSVIVMLAHWPEFPLKTRREMTSGRRAEDPLSPPYYRVNKCKKIHVTHVMRGKSTREKRLLGDTLDQRSYSILKFSRAYIFHERKWIASGMYVHKREVSARDSSRCNVIPIVMRCVNMNTLMRNRKFK